MVFGHPVSVITVASHTSIDRNILENAMSVVEEFRVSEVGRSSSLRPLDGPCCCFRRGVFALWPVDSIAQNNGLCGIIYILIFNIDIYKD